MASASRSLLVVTMILSDKALRTVALMSSHACPHCGGVIAAQLWGPLTDDRPSRINAVPGEADDPECPLCGQPVRLSERLDGFTGWISVEDLEESFRGEHVILSPIAEQMLRSKGLL